MKRLALLALLVACGSKKQSDPPPAPKQPATPADAAATTAATPDAAAARGPGIDLAGMDPAVKPGDDFFRFANGTWFAKTEIPADRSNYGTGAIITELTNQRVADLVKTDTGKVGTYYTTYLDDAAIEQRGLAPLQPTLDRIAAIADADALSAELGATLRADVDATNNTDFETPNLFGVWVAQDFRDPARNVPFLLQGGLLMPDRDYYLSANARMTETRAKYLAHLGKLLALAKVPDPDAAAKQVVELETAIAKVHVPHEASQDMRRGLVGWKLAEFAARAPGMTWDKFFAAAGLGAQPEIIVWHPTAVTGISTLVKSQPLAAWKAYLTAHAIEHAAAVLPKAIADESFEFLGHTLAGTPAMPERWKRAIDATSDALGMEVGRIYVGKYFPEAAKQRAAQMVKNVLAAFDKRIDQLAWMTPATKAKAKAKLAVLEVGVGYPDAWPDYSGLEVRAGDAFGNRERAELFEYQRSLGKLGKPVDRHEWVMNPQLVNAVNLPAMNAMNFPAAILQPPYFDPERPDVMNYGAIGAIIGHEISHSFDDQGALFDASGRLANWWTPADLDHFHKASEKLAAQFSAYKPLPDLAVNGKLTLSENIADVAGLAAAYDAYRLSLGDSPPAKVGDYTGDQLFFLAYAQSWRGKIREPAMRARLLTDGHAPVEYRADTVRNLDAWYAAFSVADGKLFLAPDARVRIW